jgi:hypothetical protein
MRELSGMFGYGCDANKVTLMKITELIWLDEVIEKIKSKHHCLPTDARGSFCR